MAYRRRYKRTYKKTAKKIHFKDGRMRQALCNTPGANKTTKYEGSVTCKLCLKKLFPGAY